MSKKISPEKLTLGIRKELNKEFVPRYDIEKVVQKIHSPVRVETEEATKRTTLDIPKDLHKKICVRALDKDLTLRAYFIELAKKDLGIA